MTNKGVIFDRDGTLIKYLPYLSNSEDIELVSGVTDVLKQLKKNGYLIFLHTNQSGVSRGLFSIEDVNKCNREMLRLINLGNDVFKEICVALDFPPTKDSFRKPSPRFGNHVINKYDIDKKDLTYVGDNITDLETAKNIGCKAIGVNYGVHKLSEKIKLRDDMNYPVYNNLFQVCNQIIN